MNWDKTDKIINGLLNKLGLSLKRYPGREGRKLIYLLKKHNIHYCLDVGANTGQFALSMFETGYKGKIISFEPQSAAFIKLKKKAAKNLRWSAYNYALGSENCETEINVSKNSVSSSLLNIMGNHVNAEPESQYVSKETIQVKKLDSIYDELLQDNPCFLKCDTQGFEMNVLKGGEKIMDKIIGIQLEMTFIPLYSGQVLFDELKQYIEGKGFCLCSIESGFSDEKTGCLLQADALFFKIGSH